MHIDSFLAAPASFTSEQSNVAAVATALIGFAALAWLALPPVAESAASTVEAPRAAFAAVRTEMAVASMPGLRQP